MERHVLEKILSPNLRAYVVWLPVLRAGNVEAAARRETRLVADQRASHFSASDARLGNRFGPIIHLPEGVPAWDVYFIFGPAVHWDATPPPPTYWMHQLGRSAPAELRLDGSQLARVVTGLLGAIPKATHGSRRDPVTPDVPSKRLTSPVPLAGPLISALSPTAG